MMSMKLHFLSCHFSSRKRQINFLPQVKLHFKLINYWQWMSFFFTGCTRVCTLCALGHKKIASSKLLHSLYLLISVFKQNFSCNSDLHMFPMLLEILVSRVKLPLQKVNHPIQSLLFFSKGNPMNPHQA